MANIVSFKIQIEGSDSIKTITFSADELGKALKAVRESSDRLSGSIVNWAQAGQAAEMLGSMLGQVTSAMSALTDAYAVQEAAETRLAQAMRNTMGATDESIDAIKRLCASQQALGIIGEEVQLSGAQELATYLEKQSSLERLIPVMNDMLAQQYEYNATAENAAQIASMLGKVMNGQTEALSRYGYKFDEAQKQILQFGTEEQRAAVLAQVVEQSVGGMNAAMARTPVGRMTQMANTVGDLKERFGALATKIMPVVQGFSSLTQAGIGLGKIISSVKSLSAAIKATEISAKALKIAMGGIAAVVLTGVITAMGLMANRTREAQEAAEKANEEYRQMQDRLAAARGELELDIQKLSTFNGTVEEEKKLVGEMNSKWGESFGTFSTVSEWYKTLSENIDTYCSMLANQIELEKIANDIAQAKIDNREKEKLLSETPATAYRTYSGTAGGSMTVAVENKDYTDLQKAIDANNKVIKDGNARMQELLQERSDLMTHFNSGGGGGGNGGSSLAADIAAYRNSLRAAMDVQSAFHKEQDDYVATANAMVSGITSLIRKYGLENEQVQALIKEYTDLREAKLGTRLPAIESSSALQAPGLTVFANTTPLFNNIESTTKNLSSLKDVVDGASSALGSLGSTMSSISGIVDESAASWLKWGANLLNVIGQALPKLAALFTANMAAASAEGATAVASIPIVGPIMAVAAVASIVGALAALPKFAAGGLAYGPTLGLFGEYPGAANNPEVVAPLNKLRDLIEPSAGWDGQVDFRIDGYALRGVLKKVERQYSRTNG